MELSLSSTVTSLSVYVEFSNFQSGFLYLVTFRAQDHRGFQTQEMDLAGSHSVGLAGRSWPASGGWFQGQFGLSEPLPCSCDLRGLSDGSLAVLLVHLLGGRVFPGRAAWRLLARCAGLNGVLQKFMSFRTCEWDLIWK